MKQIKEKKICKRNREEEEHPIIQRQPHCLPNTVEAMLQHEHVSLVYIEAVSKEAEGIYKCMGPYGLISTVKLMGHPSDCR